jgi:hypothetical protein
MSSLAFATAALASAVSTSLSGGIRCRSISVGCARRAPERFTPSFAASALQPQRSNTHSDNPVHATVVGDEHQRQGRLQRSRGSAHGNNVGP